MFKNSISTVVKNQLKSVSSLLDQDYTIDQLIEYLTFNTQVNLFVSGVGKSGHIGRKIASTLVSTGTRSFFIHPTEALHGDLGMIQQNDAILLISNSGESEEILLLIEKLKKRKIKTVAITGNKASTLASNTDYQLYYTIERESCPLNLAPMDSCTCQLIIGDCLAHNLMVNKKFDNKNFAINHPGGSLGKKLLSKASDLIDQEKLSIIDVSQLDLIINFETVVVSLSKYKSGLVIIYGENQNIGVFTSGDLQRLIKKNHKNVFDLNIYNFINFQPTTIDSNATYDEVLAVFNLNQINNLIVVDKMSNKAIGIINKNKIK